MNSKTRYNSTRKRIAVAGAVVFLAIVLAYANHFHNGFHFDDFHTVQNNPAIRSLSNVPTFFKDGRTFSVLPSNASYRPLVTTTLALDYWLAGGLNPFWFHVPTFILFLVQLGLMYELFKRISVRSRSREQAGWLALFATAWYGLHPASAETVNYVVQRADLHAALGMVASFVIYCTWPKGRRWGIYLLPVAVASFSKVTALVFPAILFTYYFLFEADSADSSSRLVRWRHAAFAAVPSMAICGALAAFQTVMTPPTFVPGGTARGQYLMTQPIVLLHYFKSFFLPTHLTADTDRGLVQSIFTMDFFVGFAFLALLVVAAVYAERKRGLRPIAFGLWWFLIGSLPTSLIPLAEVENDHRMFLPFIGLALAVTTAIAVWLDKREHRWSESFAFRAVLTSAGACILCVSAYGTHLRNEVWRTEESLWKDVTLKSPHNGRGLMNYGLTLLSKGEIQAAYDNFKKATLYTPNYSTLEINLGIAAGELHRDHEAEDHFKRAIALAPQSSTSYSYYGRWLNKQRRIPEAITILTHSAQLNAADLFPRNMLMQIYSQKGEWDNVRNIAGEILRLAPDDAEALRYASMASNPSKPQLTAADYLNLSLQHYQSGRFEDCITAAREALRLRPDYAEAYNNIAAAYQSMGRWDEAIAAATQAVRLKPDFQLARNNLAYASSQKVTARN